MTTERFTTLREALYERSPESRERVAAEVARLTEELGLTELRTLRERTQAQIAAAVGTSQSGISRLERQHDVLVSTLRDYVAATGGTLHLVARYPDHDVEIDLPVLAEQPVQRPTPRSFRVVWQNLHTRRFVHVGSLEFTGSEFVFTYTPDAELDPDFEPFPQFPDLRGTYRSRELFPFFADRLASTARPDYDDLVEALGLTRAEATPVELLTRSWGTSPHDTIQVVPEPFEHPDGTETLPFLVSGTRHADEDDPAAVTERISNLSEGQPLELRDEPENPTNDRAIALDAHGRPVGWIPDYLLDDVHKQRAAGKTVSVVVEQANGPEIPWHLRLLCRLEVRPR